MISIRAVLFGLLAATLFTPTAAAEVNIIYPPKRERPVAYQEEARPVARARATVNQVVTVVVVRGRHRESRGEIAKRALFRNWTGFIDEYSGPKYPF
jgi:hypothetical protein